MPRRNGMPAQRMVAVKALKIRPLWQNREAFLFWHGLCGKNNGGKSRCNSTALKVLVAVRSCRIAKNDLDGPSHILNSLAECSQGVAALDCRCPLLSKNF